MLSKEIWSGIPLSPNDGQKMTLISKSPIAVSAVLMFIPCAPLWLEHITVRRFISLLCTMLINPSVACCVGHEIVGTAVRVGHNVNHIKLGDRVGVGAQARSCLKCTDCAAGREQYCRHELIATYGFEYPRDEGRSYGGFSDYNRTNGRFVVKIPAGLPSELAAPMLCAGITMFSPLRRNNCGPGKRVGIIGIGGLGHFGILFAKALGATVVALSRNAAKRDEVLNMGASRYIATEEEENWPAENEQTLDLIICTISSDAIPIDDYISVLKTGGTFIQVG